MSIGEEIQKAEAPKKNHRWDWLLWWRIDAIQLDEQVRLYSTIGFPSSMRGISVACLGLSIALTIAMFLLGGLKAYAFIDVAILAVLALFIWQGHRWAMISAMVVWTFEKALTILGNPVSFPVQLLWWALYMHAFYFAFCIERHRRTLARTTAA